MKKIVNKISIMIIAFLIILLMMSLNVKAGYQANKGEKGTCTTANNLFIGIRKMESGVLNKQMNLDEENGTYKDISGNGIDCHMILSTEWGTAAMLAQSAYGASPTAVSDTTTKNESGIYYMIENSTSSNPTNRYEYVAGIYDGATNDYMGTISKADERYYNKYTDSTSNTYKGDALTEITWVSGGWVSSSAPVFLRGYYALFGFSGNSGVSSTKKWNSQGHYDYWYYSSRATVVCGQGL